MSQKVSAILLIMMLLSSHSSLNELTATTASPTQGTSKRVWPKLVGDGEDKGDKGDKGDSFYQPTTYDQSPSKIKPVAERLLGRWQAKDPKSDKVFTFIFAPDGKLFVVLPTPDGSSVASKVSYQINPTTQPMQLNMVVSPDEKVLTVFELTPEGKLRIELEGLNPGQPRPTVVSSKSTLFEKISDSTALPENVQTIDAQKNNTSQNNVVKQYITILSRAQQAYFLENGKFATDIKELGIISNLETEFYRYQIVPQKDSTQSVAIAAIPKTSELPSYIGAVFATKISGKTTTATQICETDKPSTLPPAIPAAPIGGSSKIQCPAGSHPLR
jgi:hypothetical protein